MKHLSKLTYVVVVTSSTPRVTLYTQCYKEFTKLLVWLLDKSYDFQVHRFPQSPQYLNNIYKLFLPVSFLKL